MWKNFESRGFCDPAPPGWDFFGFFSPSDDDDDAGVKTIIGKKRKSFFLGFKQGFFGF